MQKALACARQAAAFEEVPVGAIVVQKGCLVAQGWNQPIGLCDPSAHAEMVAIRAAAQALGNYRLGGCTLYVTLEPCLMCLGLMIHARLDRVVFGAFDQKQERRAVDMKALNHALSIQGGVCEVDCARLLQCFFQQKRK